MGVFNKRIYIKLTDKRGCGEHVTHRIKFSICKSEQFSKHVQERVKEEISGHELIQQPPQTAGEEGEQEVLYAGGKRVSRTINNSSTHTCVCRLYTKVKVAMRFVHRATYRQFDWSILVQV